jgi:uncharacterized membrane protein
MGTVGLILGILARGIAFIPGIGLYIASPLALISMILCAIAISNASVEKKPFAPALIGAMLSIAAF